MQLMPLDDVASDVPADVFVGPYEPCESPHADTRSSGFVFSDCRPFATLKATCLLAMMWPHEITADGVFWVDSQPDICFRLRIAEGTASYRPAGRWLASRSDADALPAALTRAIAGREWDPVYGDRVQRIRFENANADRARITDMLRRNLIDDTGGLAASSI